MCRKSLAVLCLSLAASACASATLHVVQPVIPPAREVTLAIGSSTPSISSEQLSALRTQLTSRLESDGISVVPAPGANTCRVQGTIDHYDRGSRALRYFFGFVGAGKGTFDSSWHVTGADGKEIGQCRIDGGLWGGAFGGSYEGVLDEASKRLAGCLLNEPAR